MSTEIRKTIRILHVFTRNPQVRKSGLYRRLHAEAFKRRSLVQGVIFRENFYGKQLKSFCSENLTLRQWLRIQVDVPIAHWLRIRAANFYLFNDLSAHIVRTSVCHWRSCGTSTHICSLPRGQWIRIRVDILTIHLPVFVAHELKIRADVPPVGMSARIYSPCATHMGKQGELDQCRYLHIGIGLAVIHRCPQLLASLENWIHTQNCEKSAHRSS